MDGGIEQPLPPALRGLPVAWVFLDVRDEPCVEDGFAVMPGIKPAIEIEMRAVNVQIRQSGHPLQGVQSLWQEYRIGLIHRRHRKRSQPLCRTRRLKIPGGASREDCFRRRGASAS